MFKTFDTVYGKSVTRDDRHSSESVTPTFEHTLDANIMRSSYKLVCVTEETARYICSSVKYNILLKSSASSINKGTILPK